MLGGCTVKPQPFTTDEHMARFLSDKEDLAALQNMPKGPISLYEAVARTIKYNLDNRLARMEAAFAMDQLGAAQLQMLPKLAVNAGYTFRDNESASSSISYRRRVETLEPSVSSERERTYGDISFSWSLLDFGISYFQAKQQANSYLILQERRRRIMNNLVKEVIAAYCRLASLEKIHPQVQEAMAEAEKALASYRKLEEDKTALIADALERQRSILNVLKQLRQLSTDMAIARSRLATLMNVPHGVHFTIEPLSESVLQPPPVTADLALLEDIGVFFRPDLREESYRSLIDKAEVKKEIVRMFPGVTLLAGANYDSNKYLVNNYWAEAGARASLNIFEMPSRIKMLQAAQKQVDVAKMRRLAGTVAAILQIDMSYFQYRLAIDHFADSKELSRIDERLFEISSAAAASQSIGRMEHIMRSVSNVSTRLDSDRLLVDVFAAWANLYFSIGCDVLVGVSGEEDLSELSAMVEEGLTRMLAGDLPSLPASPESDGAAIPTASNKTADKT